MTDYRIQDKAVREEYFYKYFLWSLKKFDCDSNLFLLNYIHTRMELNIEQRFWMAWLYGNTYQLATAWVLANEFPDFENVDMERLTEWNNSNYKRLRYQSDQKWQKGHLPEMFVSYRENIKKFGGDQEHFFKAICSSEDPYENFDRLYKYIIKNFYKFGRYSAWFYIQTLKETCGLNVSSRTLLLEDENTHTQRAGLCYINALDFYAGDKQSHKHKMLVDVLNVTAEMIVEDFNRTHPELRCDMFLLETCLCAFKKTFRKKKGRYLGYYLDRQYEDIKQVESDGWFGIDFDLLWGGRNEILDPKTIGGRYGVNKEDMKFFLNTGNIKYIEYMDNPNQMSISAMQLNPKQATNNACFNANNNA